MLGLFCMDEATKIFTEGFIKLSKCLKDMLDNLTLKHQTTNGIEIVGFIHSGQQSILVRANRPTQHITRAVRSKPINISSNVSNFGLTALPSLYSAWITRKIVKRVQFLLDTPIPINTADSSWLEIYWTQNEPVIMPETSTSLETSDRNRKKSKANV